MKIYATVVQKLEQLLLSNRCKLKSCLIAPLFSISLLSPPDYDKLANAIYQHENSIKFPYGAEHRIDGKLVGYSPATARAICIKLCRNAYRHWDGKGDYFQCLNKIYAADKTWWRDVENKYNKQTKGK